MGKCSLSPALADLLKRVRVAAQNSGDELTGQLTGCLLDKTEGRFSYRTYLALPLLDSLILVVPAPAAPARLARELLYEAVFTANYIDLHFARSALVENQLKARGGPPGPGVNAAGDPAGQVTIVPAYRAALRRIPQRRDESSALTSAMTDREIIYQRRKRAHHSLTSRMLRDQQGSGYMGGHVAAR